MSKYPWIFSLYLQWRFWRLGISFYHWWVQTVQSWGLVEGFDLIILTEDNGFGQCNNIDECISTPCGTNAYWSVSKLICKNHQAKLTCLYGWNQIRIFSSGLCLVMNHILNLWLSWYFGVLYLWLYSWIWNWLVQRMCWHRWMWKRSTMSSWMHK